MCQPAVFHVLAQSPARIQGAKELQGGKTGLFITVNLRNPFSFFSVLKQLKASSLCKYFEIFCLGCIALYILLQVL